ncbi:MAG: bifunctional UDP-N-acetylglucosamine diphosphorylase/glucosamine-1-phosphate N-acetyltransferase GlmU [Anaerolineales bacterium]|nr:bifunctional UDP-N-acetylglucosamine diphosphorylase/glucosamine-1-phosphate N-acetyltransferase GlmU [Anaerolineales bacterium]
MRINAVLLAAGQGTRMRSKLPKVLHPLLGKPMIHYAVEAAQQVTGQKPVVVVGHGAQAIQQALGDSARFVYQEPQLGTGHAVLQAEPLLKNEADFILVTYADMPLLTPDTLQLIINTQQQHSGPLTMLTVVADDPHGFGRIVRDEAGRVTAIVEEAQATPEQRAIRELNASVYCFEARWLWEMLPRIPISPKGEYYLTDLIGMAVADGLEVQSQGLADAQEGIGINNRLHLAEAEALMRKRINHQWMLNGVTIVDPSSTYIETSVHIGMDTTIWPNTFLQGATVVGEACNLGPNTIVRNSQLGDRCTVFASILECAVVEDEVDIGPYAHLRSGTHLGRGVHIGNFGETKNSSLGPGTKMGHFSYIGDATIGPNVNIGAGTITCNFDGRQKNPTEIGEGAFIGSDTMLVAPVKIGVGARTGAGAVVTRDVPENTLAVGVPARAIRKLEKRG